MENNVMIFIFAITAGFMIITPWLPNSYKRKIKERNKDISTFYSSFDSKELNDAEKEQLTNKLFSTYEECKKSALKDLWIEKIVSLIILALVILFLLCYMH